MKAVRTSTDRANGPYARCADDDVFPIMTEWMDAQLAADKRMLMTLSTTNLHMDYYFPHEPVPYTELNRPNLYLNALKWTDDVFGQFLDLLATRGLLENSLIVVQGDHGPHLSANGGLRFGPHDSIFKVPLAMRMPNGAFQARVPNSEPFTSIDVLPTVLDALGVNASLIRPYPGRSILRPPTTERYLFTADTPGKTTPCIHAGSMKVAQMAEGVWCACDVVLDPEQLDPMCFEARDGLDSTLDYFPNQQGDDQLDIIQPWAIDHAPLVLKHLAVNHDYWINGGQENLKIGQDYLAQVKLAVAEKTAFVITGGSVPLSEHSVVQP